MRPPRFRREIEAVVAATPWPDECIIFSGKQQPNGYGRVSRGSGKYVRSNRLACQLAHGEPPTEKHTDAAHSCGERMCINPRHLRWATRSENEQDKKKHGRFNHAMPDGRASILTKEQVINIRAEYAASGITQQQLAYENGVHIMTINDIIKRRTWVF